MRALGVDPGTGNFDFLCIEDDVDRVVLDETIPSKVVAHETGRIVELVKSVSPEVVVGPSGYGLPLKPVDALTDEDLALTTLEKKTDSGIPVLSGVRRLLRMMRDEGIKAYMVPGVVQLPSVPVHRKINRIDMGTADKTCVAAYAVWDQARRSKIRYEETRLVCVEAGMGYNAALAVENGKIVDGLGGTNFPGPGFLSHGSMDGELAYLLGGFSKRKLFEGGASFTPTGSEVQLDYFVQNRYTTFGEGWRCFVEGVVKAVAALTASMDSKPLEVILTGRLSRIPELRQDMTSYIQRKLGMKSRRPENVFAKNAKDVAMGAAILANGIAGGKYSDLVECLEVRKSHGTVLDYVRIPGFDPAQVVGMLRSD
ncbi:MAG: DUF1464 family protein [Candidatus Caldarchaeum sp.]|nr:DUF1464 family protein [Candidatus Caldarchaeum sp.]